MPRPGPEGWSSQAGLSRHLGGTIPASVLWASVNILTSCAIES